MSASERKEPSMYELATMRVLIAVAIVSVLGIGVSFQAAGARPVDPDAAVVPKLLKSPTTQRLPNEPSVVQIGVPGYAQFIRVAGTNRYRVKSLHGGLDD
jgi:hypothetical protein